MWITCSGNPFINSKLKLYRFEIESKRISNAKLEEFPLEK